MAQLGQEVGSDVPFFFYRPTALVEGRGERITPLQLEAERWLLLVNPGIAISTAWAYERLAAVRAGQVGRMPGRLPRLAVDHGGEGPQLVKWHDLLPLIENDFAPVPSRARNRSRSAAASRATSPIADPPRHDRPRGGAGDRAFCRPVPPEPDRKSVV